MIYLQVWLGDKKPDINIMKSVQKCATKRDQYILISDKKYIKENCEWISIKKYIKQFSDDNDLKFLFDKAMNTHPMFVSDLVRFTFAIDNDKVLYLDTDIEIVKKPKFTNKNSIHFERPRDVGLFYNGKGNGKFFKEILDELCYRYKHLQIKKPWIRNILNKKKEYDIDILESSNFINRGK